MMYQNIFKQKNEKKTKPLSEEFSNLLNCMKTFKLFRLLTVFLRLLSEFLLILLLNCDCKHNLYEFFLKKKLSKL